MHTKLHIHTQNFACTHKTTHSHKKLLIHTQNYTHKQTNNTLITTPISGEAINMK